MKTIIIKLDGGQIKSIKHIPPHVQVKVLDYDVQYGDGQERRRDKDNKEYCPNLWESDQNIQYKLYYIMGGAPSRSYDESFDENGELKEVIYDTDIEVIKCGMDVKEFKTQEELSAFCEGMEATHGWDDWTVIDEEKNDKLLEVIQKLKDHDNSDTKGN